MPNELLCVRADTYWAGIWLDAIPSMPLEKYRKLMRLMAEYPADNREAFEQLGLWLREHRATSKRTEKMLQIYRDYKNKGDFCHGSHNF